MPYAIAVSSMQAGISNLVLGLGRRLLLPPDFYISDLDADEKPAV